MGGAAPYTGENRKMDRAKSPNPGSLRLSENIGEEFATEVTVSSMFEFEFSTPEVKIRTKASGWACYHAMYLTFVVIGSFFYLAVL